MAEHKIVDVNGRPLNTGDEVVIVDFRGDDEGKRCPTWDETMVKCIGHTHVISGRRGWGSRPQEEFLLLVDTEAYVWRGRWLRRKRGGLAELVGKYRA